MASIGKLEPEVRISITNPKSEMQSVFGKGIANLCAGVRDKGSLYAAAKAMGMAYSKAWRIIKCTEESLGLELLIRDGAHGSELTREGSKLLDVYLGIEKELSKKAMELYKKLSK